ncbi:hypothetical protein [Metabacillus malikii]|uniref:Membrane protein YeaQ/YmgE (Transglycosylase-associated protein family) n=1 Tax=Metabacillus malikii TaxID=1504265 RepID=A0ABT9ZDV6_9BACI|nr:hypothetical protein [Metabacillus malikii]MDQ0230443.1 putative membrane protein YeaQ/YmgE (transglycosylase-associated protein family) [Metabacillus malikii]
MNIFLICMLVLNGVVGIVTYIIFKKKSKLFNDRYGMNIAMVSSSIISFQSSMLIAFISNDETFMTAAITMLICGLVGGIIGSLVKYQALLSGFFHGVVGSVTGNMLGMVILNPALCSLPAAFSASIEQNVYLFSLFGFCLVILTIGLLIFSLRV